MSTNTKWTVVRVKKELGGKLIGNANATDLISHTILLLPSEIIEFVCKNVWFISSPDDAWAFTFKGSEIKGKSLIFLSDELLSQSKEQVRYTILHEVGHVVLKHRNSIGFIQSEKEIQKQENEADAFAKEFLR